jgi:hypothetical protein
MRQNHCARRRHHHVELSCGSGRSRNHLDEAENDFVASSFGVGAHIAVGGEAVTDWPKGPLISTIAQLGPVHGTIGHFHFGLHLWKLVSDHQGKSEHFLVILSAAALLNSSLHSSNVYSV